MSGTAEAAWSALNERQRLYLSTILELDQAAEAEIRRQSAQRILTPPAAQWRQITYDIKLPKEIAGYSSVQSVLRERSEHDTGSGSSLAALRRRGLVEVTYDQVEVPPLGMVDRIRVRLTTAGRAAARYGTGAAAPAAVPAGLLSRLSLIALAALYAAGESGLCNEDTRDRADAAPSWTTLLRLRDRRDGSLIGLFLADRSEQDRHVLRQHRVRCSARGRRHFAVHRACYAELYPDLDLPDLAPDDVLAHAHNGLAGHRAPRPKHLLRDGDLRVLLELAALEEASRCYLREVITEQYQRRGEPVPGWVGQIPAGLLPWQVKDLTRSGTSIGRLAATPGGPLVEQIGVAAHLPYTHADATTPLVVLTDHGRAHLRDHLADYRRHYPELDLPELATHQERP
jgi:hypothetical protein